MMHLKAAVVGIIQISVAVAKMKDGNAAGDVVYKVDVILGAFHLLPQGHLCGNIPADAIEPYNTAGCVMYRIFGRLCPTLPAVLVRQTLHDT